MSFCMSSCHKVPKEPDKVAIYFVQNLQDENYEECIKLNVSCDSTSDEYRQNIKNLYKIMVRNKKEKNGNLKDIEHVSTNIKNNMASVLLKLTYSNDSSETILIPLFQKDSRWRLR